MAASDKAGKNHLMALGSAAVLAVYGAGFVRTRAAAERFDGAEAERRPAAPVARMDTIAPAAPIASAAPIAPTAPVKTPTSTVTVAPKQELAKPGEPKVQPETTKTEAPVAAAVTPVDTAAVVAALRDGTYSGWGSSRHGDIQTTVEIRNGRITSATISQCLTRYSCSWVSALPGQVVARQSADVDYVSGATESSNAFYYGVVEALKKAK
ncbi:MAG: hypothetical protein JWM95_1444 [Gemmatimonadetes bacterium]|nr:hypothetical protein [Gemmatimonadota bacterium]